MSSQSGQGGMAGCATAAVLAILTLLVVIVAFSSCSGDPKQVEYGKTLAAEIATALPSEPPQKPLSGNLPTPFSLDTATPPAAVMTQSCVPAPALIDPSGANLITPTRLTLQWTSDHVLKPGEAFDVFVSPDVSELTAMNDTNQPAIVGRTTGRALTIDLPNWRYAGRFGEFFWSVRIADAARTFIDCAPAPTRVILRAPITDTPTRVLTWTPTRVPTATPTPVPCSPAPLMYDPPDGKSFAAKNTVLRWRSDYALQPDEEFAVLAWIDGDAQPTVLARTRDKIAPLDLQQWAFAGRFGYFFWSIRIQRTDGMIRSCAGPAFSFNLIGYTPDSGPPPLGPPPKPPCGAGLICR